MAEVVGLAASVLQIGGAGAKLSVELYNFINTAARADIEITHIAVDVEVTSNVLGNVGKVLEEDNAQKLVNQDAVQHAKDLIQQCEQVFNELSDVVEKARKTGKDGRTRVGFRARMGWPMKEQRVELLRRRLETLKSSLLVLFHVLQLAQDKARGDVEVAYLEEQKRNIRQLHQQQQDSLKILKALERKLCTDNADNGGPLQRSTIPASSSQDAITISAVASSNTAADDQIKRNNLAMDLFKNLEPDTSDSEAMITGDEGEHLTLDELAQCAMQVQKLLRRIMALQDSLKSGQAEQHHRKRRLHKVYQRFCRKFEANIVDPTSAPLAKASGTEDECVAANPSAAQNKLRPAHSRQQSVQSAQSASRPVSSRRDSRASRQAAEERPNIKTQQTHAPKHRNARVGEECTTPDCKSCHGDIESQRRQSRRHSLALNRAQPQGYAPRPPYHNSLGPVVQPAASRRLSVSIRPASFSNYREDQPTTTPSTSRHVSTISRAEQSVSYHELSRPPSTVSSSTSSSYMMPSYHGGDQPSAYETHMSASRERVPSSSMSAYIRHYPSAQGSPVPYSLPNPYYSQPQHTMFPYESERPQLSARASSGYGDYPTPVVQVDTARASNMPAANYCDASNSQAGRSRIEHYYSDEPSGSDSSSQPQQAGERRYQHHTRQTRRNTSAPETRYLNSISMGRPSVRHANATPTARAARRRPQTVVLTDQHSTLDSLQIQPSRMGRPQSILDLDHSDGTSPPRDMVKNSFHSRTEMKGSSDTSTHARRPESRRIEQQQVNGDKEHGVYDERHSLHHCEARSKRSSRSYRNDTANEEPSLSEVAKTSKFEHLLLGKAEEQSSEREAEMKKYYAQMAENEQRKNLIIAQQDIRSYEVQEKKHDAENTVLNKAERKEQYESSGEGDVTPNSDSTAGDSTLKKLNVDNCLHTANEQPSSTETGEPKGSTLEHHQKEMQAFERKGKERLEKPLEEQQDQQSSKDVELHAKERSLLRRSSKTFKFFAEGYQSDRDLKVSTNAYTPPKSKTRTEGSSADNLNAEEASARNGEASSPQDSNELSFNRASATTAKNTGNEIRLRVDPAHPLSLSFNGDMEGRTLQVVPAEGEMSNIVIGSCRRGAGTTYQSEKGRVRGAETREHRRASRVYRRREAEEVPERSLRGRRARRVRREEDVSPPRIFQPATRKRGAPGYYGDGVASDGNQRRDDRCQDGEPMDIVDVLLERWTKPLDTAGNTVSHDNSHSSS